MTPYDEIRYAYTPERLLENVAHSLTLGLPELKAALPVRRGSLAMIANGPTALDAPLRREPSMALNGALGLYSGTGQGPTFWAAMDPQALVANFLRDPPEDTIYYVASRCDPAVFEALRDRHVVLWHAFDEQTMPLIGRNRFQVMGSTSVTLCAMNLASSLGFRLIETWGWDGCYLGDADHAVPQRHVAERVEVMVGNKSFLTCGTWLLEAHQAKWQLERCDYRVTVNGPGMFQTILGNFDLIH